jgi:hypothetical protein
MDYMKKKIFKPLLFLLGFQLIVILGFAQAKRDTIESLRDPSVKKAIYKAPDGKTYKVQFWETNLNADISRESLQCGEDGYKGSARKEPKTSLAKSNINKFNSIRELILKLPKDSIMVKRFKALTKVQLAIRQTEEKSNVSLNNNIFLFAIKREPDNDYHVIIGDRKNYKIATLLNIEISGIANTDRVALQKVRNFFESNFVDVCGSKYAVFIEEPIPIMVEGSLFYDIDHK